MSVVVYRGNLSSAFFPFISRFQGRTVIIPGQDNNFNRQLQSSADMDKDIGIPQIYYCHNVMPNGNGYQSVGYEQRVGSYDGNDKGIVQQLLLRDDSMGAKGYFALGIGGLYYILNESYGYSGLITQYWDGAALVNLPPNIVDYNFTTAHVNGITYLYISGFNCFRWDFTNNRLALVTLTSLTPTEIVGLTESNGYLVAYSTNAVAWSSLIDPTDFTPSLATGAGGGNVEGIKGNITCGAPTSNGFILYTEANAVSVLYTGNSQYPFQFSECLGAGGLSSLERVSYDADSGYNYAYTSNGFQVLKAKSAESIFADLTDFLAGQYFEDFDDDTLEFIETTLSSPLVKKITFIANRYLVVSHGITELTHAIVYDTVQKRFGKFKFTHADCFQYELLSEDVSDIPRKSIAFIKSDGSIHLVNFALPFTSRNGTVLLGKYQYARVRTLQLQEAEIEGPTSGGVFSVHAMVSTDGKNYSQTVEGTQLYASADIGVYGFGSPVGINHSLLCQGAFNLTSLVLKFNVHGRL
jgi:hypothetical protein